MQEDLLYKYALMEYYQKNNGYLIDSFKPLIIHFLGSSSVSLDTNGIKDGLKDKYNLKIPQLTLVYILNNMKRKRYILKEETKYFLSNQEISINIMNVSKISYIFDILHVLKERNEPVTIEELYQKIETKYLNIDINAVRFSCERLKESKILDSIAERYRLDNIGFEFFSSLESEEEVRERLNYLYEEAGNYFIRENNLTLEIKKMQNIILSFIQENIQPLFEFLNTRDFSPEKYKIKNKEEQFFCNFLVSRVCDKNITIISVIKDLMIASIVSISFNHKLPLEEKMKLKEVIIFLDTNLLFSLLGYGFNNFTFPTRELFQIIKEYEFRIMIFDFTIIEAKDVIAYCIENYSLENVRLNSICSFFKIKGFTEKNLRTILAGLEDEIKDLGVEVYKTNVDLNNYQCKKELRDSMRIYKKNQPRIPQTHDIAAIKKIKEIRGESVNNIYAAKAIFLTADESLYAFDLRVMSHSVPEVFSEKLLANILWLIDPSEEIPIVSLLAACPRDRNSWFAMQNIMQSLGCVNERDIVDLVTSELISESFGATNIELEIDKKIVKRLEENMTKEIVQFEPIQNQKRELEQKNEIVANLTKEHKEKNDLINEDSKSRIFKLIDEEWERANKGVIVFNCPKQMVQGTYERIEARIARNLTEQLSEGLKGRGMPEFRRLKIFPIMKAKLDGLNFEIKSISPEQQIIGRDHTQWSWDVIPLKKGNQILHLLITAILIIPDLDNLEKQLPILDWPVEVRVDHKYVLSTFVQKNWQFIIGTLFGSGLILWFFERHS